jgi:hypothetical protein
MELKDVVGHTFVAVSDGVREANEAQTRTKFCVVPTICYKTASDLHGGGEAF